MAKTYEDLAKERQDFVDRLSGTELVDLIEQAATRLVLARVLDETREEFIASVAYAHRVLGFGVLKIMAENDRDTHDYSR